MKSVRNRSQIEGCLRDMHGLSALPMSPHCRGVAAVRLTSLSTGKSWYWLCSKPVLLHLRPVYRQLSASPSSLVNSAWVCQKPIRESSPALEFAKAFSPKERRKSKHPSHIPAQILAGSATCFLFVRLVFCSSPHLLLLCHHCLERHTQCVGTHTSAERAERKMDEKKGAKQRRRKRLEGKAE